MTTREAARRRRLWRLALAAAADALVQNDGAEAQEIIEELRRFVARKLRELA